jgi:hypothetical protein
MSVPAFTQELDIHGLVGIGKASWLPGSVQWRRQRSEGDEMNGMVGARVVDCPCIGGVHTPGLVAQLVTGPISIYGMHSSTRRLLAIFRE